MLKGGVALELRWGYRARFTRDLDLGRLDTEENANGRLFGQRRSIWTTTLSLPSSGPTDWTLSRMGWP